ncbi:MAG: SIMPL domain-containing protein [Firmicutes bacterium]|nr:SIMPL domain-containing protein [Bacillota bacterium]MDH7496261.1 SIMPL domain-containing protein [Bacillota bacterium]
MSNHSHRLIAAAAAALIVVAAVVAVGARPEAAQEGAREDQKDGLLRVSGTGIVDAKPDLARVSLGVETLAATAREAQERSNETAASVVKALHDLGIADDDIVTVGLSLNPEYRYDQNKKESVLTGYRSVHTMTVTVRDVARVGKVIDALTEAGGNVVRSISFEVSDESRFRDEALEKAVKDATRKAEAAARAAGVKLKGIATITDTGGSSGMPLPTMMRAAKVDEGFSGADAGAMVATGNIQIVATVEMTFRF